MTCKERREISNPADTWFTWEEIVEHDMKSSCWIVVRGKVYDVTEFVPKHPGGDIIMDGAGGDCTPMWESYHPRALAAKGPQQRYWIGMVRDYYDFYSWEGGFYSEVKKRVEEKVPHENRRFHWTMYIKFFVILTLFFTFQYLYVAWTTYWVGICFALISA